MHKNDNDKKRQRYLERRKSRDTQPTNNTKASTIFETIKITQHSQTARGKEAVDETDRMNETVY